MLDHHLLEIINKSFHLIKRNKPSSRKTDSSSCEVVERNILLHELKEKRLIFMIRKKIGNFTLH